MAATFTEGCRQKVCRVKIGTAGKNEEGIGCDRATIIILVMTYLKRFLIAINFF